LNSFFRRRSEKEKLRGSTKGNTSLLLRIAELSFRISKEKEIIS
jgi:hypothetical protein